MGKRLTLEDLEPRYGKLTPIEVYIKKTKNISYSSGIQKSGWAKCLCDCNKEVNVAIYRLKRGTTKSCGCLRKEVIRKRGKNHPCYKGTEHIPQKFIYRVINAAKKRSLEYPDNLKDILENLWIDQKGKCALSKEKLNFGRTYSPNIDGKQKQSIIEKCTASVDRIDSKLGYIEGNIRFIHADLNFMRHKVKNDFTDDELLYWARKLVAANPE